jgi:hypothetical protein
MMIAAALLAFTTLASCGSSASTATLDTVEPERRDRGVKARQAVEQMQMPVSSPRRLAHAGTPTRGSPA